MENEEAAAPTDTPRCPACGEQLELGDFANYPQCYTPVCQFKRCLERAKHITERRGAA